MIFNTRLTHLRLEASISIYNIDLNIKCFKKIRIKIVLTVKKFEISEDPALFQLFSIDEIPTFFIWEKNTKKLLKNTKKVLNKSKKDF